ncbi:hypothetical protein Barb6XT_02399 [Bacteroidales bacterium Barb6XT]|nr:hypothetical protein Barb6XT_02399 [Bacteroidales bacterium Barb6XT]
MNNDTKIMILLTGGLLILDTLPEGARDFSPTWSAAEWGIKTSIYR